MLQNEIDFTSFSFCRYQSFIRSFIHHLNFNAESVCVTSVLRIFVCFFFVASFLQISCCFNRNNCEILFPKKTSQQSKTRFFFSSPNQWWVGGVFYVIASFFHSLTLIYRRSEKKKLCWKSKQFVCMFSLAFFVNNLIMKTNA